MSIHSSTFGGVTLTGEDAEEFQKQVRHGKATKAAVETVQRGLVLSQRFQRNGYVVLAKTGKQKRRGTRSA